MSSFTLIVSDLISDFACPESSVEGYPFSVSLPNTFAKKKKIIIVLVISLFMP